MFAATGVGPARRMSPIEAVRLGMVADATTGTRRGLGTGTREEIKRFATGVTIGPALALIDGEPLE